MWHAFHAAVGLDLLSLSVEVAEEMPFQVFPLRTRLFGCLAVWLFGLVKEPLESARVKPART